MTNVPPYDLAASLKLRGGAVTTHASIKSGKVILGVDVTTANVAGTGADTNGVPGIYTGTVSINGSVVEHQ